VIDRIHWLGHAAFRITNGKVIYIDPYKINHDSPKADLILITHDHFDHFSKEDIIKIKKKETVFVAPPSVAKALDGDVRPVKRGQRIKVGDIDIQAVAAYNIGKDFHPRSSDNVGYVVTIEGTRIYHTGDTDVIPEMKEIKTDIALLPCGGTYTLTAQEAAKAVDIIKPKIAVPMHWGSVVGSRKDAEEFVRCCKNCEVRILEKE